MHTASVILVFFSSPTNVLPCDTQLSDELGVTNQSLCLHPLTISISSANASEFTVPVLGMKPGQTCTLEILYHISASQINHQGNKANLISADYPARFPYQLQPKTRATLVSTMPCSFSVVLIGCYTSMLSKHRVVPLAILQFFLHFTTDYILLSSSLTIRTD